jgi:DNA end-binding protein Ku
MAQVRSMWNGAISFGLVNIPVSMFKATESTAKAGVQFKLLHKGCGSTIRQKRVCPIHDCEVGADDTARGVEVSKGEYVEIPQADIDAIGLLDNSSAIELVQFVEAREVDAIYYDSTYYLKPGKGAQAVAYGLVMHALMQADMVGLGKVTLVQKEKLVLLRPQHGLLFLQTLYWSEDVRPFIEIKEEVERIDPRRTRWTWR